MQMQAPGGLGVEKSKSRMVAFCKAEFLKAPSPQRLAFGTYQSPRGLDFGRSMTPQDWVLENPVSHGRMLKSATFFLVINSTLMRCFFVI